jgi:DNA topoisomerase-1
LDKRFVDLMDYGFTANMEEFLDRIASWEFKRKEVLKDFWSRFKKDLDKASKDSKVKQYVGEKCPQCWGELVYKWWKFGKFIACENYPECKYKRQTEEEKSYEQKLKEEFEWKPCPAGWKIVVKKSKNGYFLASSEYPKVKWTMSPDIYRLQLKLWEKTCPKCGKGKLVVRKGKRGHFVGCSRYPECGYVEKLKV